MFFILFVLAGWRHYIRSKSGRGRVFLAAAGGRGPSLAARWRLAGGLPAVGPAVGLPGSAVLVRLVRSSRGWSAGGPICRGWSAGRSDLPRLVRSPAGGCATGDGWRVGPIFPRRFLLAVRRPAGIVAGDGARRLRWRPAGCRRGTCGRVGSWRTVGGSGRGGDGFGGIFGGLWHCVLIARNALTRVMCGRRRLRQAGGPWRCARQMASRRGWRVNVRKRPYMCGAVWHVIRCYNM